MNQRAISRILAYQQRQKTRPSKQTYVLDTRVPQYAIALIDTSIPIPITLDKKITEVINTEFFPIVNSAERARKIYDWVQENVMYGESKRKVYSVGYRNALETLQGNEGVCGEMAYVYVTLARASGLKSSYISVFKDYAGRKVCHACAGVYLPDLLLVDPAYATYDIKHHDFKEINDSEMIRLFSAWRAA